ncbi:MAG: mannitol dehydrogenase family protein [Paracoccaceae bacterium]
MPRIVHIGLGNFHRAHQAWYTAQANDGWQITGIVMRNAALFETLCAQNGAYALAIRGPNGLRVEHINLHDRLLLACENSAGVIAAIADQQTEIVTLTITEKGYCLRDGVLDLSHPDIAADLASSTPRSAIGLLAQGLAMRFKRGASPLTVMSCDNVAANTRTLSNALDDFGRAASLTYDPANAYADTMVDRITPATSDAIAAEIAAAGGMGQAPVLTEAFSDWVIEDRFAASRPDWEAAGAEIVPDVAPYEMRKLRMLNAAHSYLAYAGQLTGLRFVHEAIADAQLCAGVNRLWDEAATTLPAGVLSGLPAYRAALVSRFSVPEMRHELAQIAMDGSLKLRERILPIITARGAKNAPQAIETIAIWMTWLARAFARNDKVHDAHEPDLRNAITGKDTKAQAEALAAWLGIPECAGAISKAALESGCD